MCSHIISFYNDRHGQVVTIERWCEIDKSYIHYTELGRGRDSVVFKCINISGVNIEKIVEILPNI
jgi:hypothetical protein